MKFILIVLAILILGGAIHFVRNKANTNTLASGDYAKSIKTADGLTRTYMVHLPTGYDVSKSYPLVLVLHGGGGNAAITERQTGFSTLSDANGFIVAYPEGTTGPVLGLLSSWNAGDCCGSAKNKIDDVSFIRQLVTSLESTYSINSAKVFATGMSNGAMLSNRLACEAADIFAGVAPVSGTIQIPVCSPSRPVPILMIHGTSDGTVPYNGGAGTGTFTKSNTFLSVPQALADWAARNKCSSGPTTTPVTPLVNDGKTVDKLAYAGCSAPTLLYRVNGGSHSWPGGVDVQLQDSNAPTQAINASQTIWDFFASL
jgi:polyhydroxybutyrate depolymerase